VAFRPRPRDLPPRGPGARGAGRRAALRARRHGDHRPPRDTRARVARARRRAARGRLHGLQLPHLRDHRAGCPARGRGAGGGCAPPRRAGAVARRGHRRRPPRGARRARGARRRAHGRQGRDRRAGGPLPAHLGPRRAALHARDRGPGLPARRLGPADAADHPARGELGERRPRHRLHLRLRLGAGRLGRRHGDRAARDGRRVRVDRAARRAAGPAAVGGDAAAHARRLGDRRPHERAARLLPRGERGARPRRRAVARRPPDRLPALRLPRPRPRRAGDRRPGDGRPDARRRRRGGRPRGGRPDDRLVRGGRRGLRAAPARAGRRHPARVHLGPRGDRASAGDLAAVRRDDARQRRGLRARRDPHRRGRHPLPHVGDARRGGRLRARRAALAGQRLGDRRRVVRPARAHRRAPDHVRRALRRQPLGAHRRPGV
ncbi:MAG: DNA-damage-inducible protein F, partial [uncultured Solirubrobacteraceae bacterium]